MIIYRKKSGLVGLGKDRVDCILSFFGLVQPTVVYFYLILFLGWVVW